MSKYNIGDKVRISNDIGFGWSKDMKRYRGEVLTIQGVKDYHDCGSLYEMFECPQWAWDDNDITELVESAKPATKPVEPTEPEPEFKVGMKVRIKGEYEDCTMRLDGKVGTIVEVLPEGHHCKVEVEGNPNIFGAWFCCNRNLTPVEDTKPEVAEPAKEDKGENKRIHFHDAPEACDDELVTAISDFTDKVLKMADKYNVERKELMDASAKALAHSVKDDFFWKVIVPSQELVWKLAEAKN